MKKVLTIVLALALVMCMAVPAFAAEGNTTLNADTNATKTIDVQATMNDSSATPESVYSVDIAWEDMTFDYSVPEGSKYVWNPETHEYALEGGEAGVWNKTTAKITATNHSNEDVKVSVAFVGENDFTGSFNQTEKVLNEGVEHKPTEADKTDFVFTLDASKHTMREDIKVGTITVTVAEVA